MVNSGTPTDSIRNRAGYKGPGAGKTGTVTHSTTSGSGGYTTDMAAVIWAGMDNGNMTLDAVFRAATIIARY
ncbi:MAG: hypothetical protein U1F16_08215 [Turneriella sp.]